LFIILLYFKPIEIYLWIIIGESWRNQASVQAEHSADGLKKDLLPVVMTSLWI